MDIKKILVSGIAAGIVIFAVSFIVDSIIGIIWPYNILELGGMKSITDPIMMLFFLSPFVWGFAMTIVYRQISSALQGDFLQKGKKFGLLVWLVAAVPSAFIVYTSMTYPIGFTVSSVFTSLFYLLAAGIVIAKLSG